MGCGILGFSELCSVYCYNVAFHWYSMIEMNGPVCKIIRALCVTVVQIILGCLVLIEADVTNIMMV